MGRPRTGSASRRDGRWVARVTLHREPHPAGTRPPRAGSILALYLVPSWERQCAEMLRLEVRGRWSTGEAMGERGQDIG